MRIAATSSRASETRPFTFKCDVREVWSDGWDLGIFHPDCRYLSVSGLHWNKRRPERAALTEKALDFFRECLNAPIRRKCVENPISCVSTRIRKPDQIIQPHQFGHPESKQTALWLVRLPPLLFTDVLSPTRFQVNGRPRWDNQTATGPEQARTIEGASGYSGEDVRGAGSSNGRTVGVFGNVRRSGSCTIGVSPIPHTSRKASMAAPIPPKA